ncbi:tripartite tricarboxylate transporter TctB family protein [Puniceibacterium sp. IMCC21224]|uniref:tripartite tricarboxylate transporter TctB family protein n=1 Tax=Puniceibacterium sp. IMCC21224 TaxID=1618204 RepID=UPI00065DA89A|nr:tripartite tricarboxylate transporter TctB family protein [Puniceibacterium sp. IMCC21224]KMK68967.1 Tripartite tricarboxylate transporter TctB family [Puniceibacterium sp. IMCC21224]
MRLISGRIVFDLVLLATMAWGLMEAISLPEAFGPGQVGPGDFPAGVMILAILFLLAVLLNDLRALRDPSDGTDNIGMAETLGVTATCALLLGYIVLLEPLGFLASTMIFLFVAVLSCSWLIDRPADAAGWRRLSVSALVLALAGSGLTYAVFTYGFGLIFP